MYSCVFFFSLEAKGPLSEHHVPEQKDGTARPSLALENLQDIEKMQGSQRDNAEAVLKGVLGSMYTGESPSGSAAAQVYFPRAPINHKRFCFVLREAGSDSVREYLTDHLTLDVAESFSKFLILVSDCSDDNRVLPNPCFVSGSPEACPEGTGRGHWGLAPP